MYVFTVTEYTKQQFGDTQCLEYLDKWLAYRGAPKEECMVDFRGCTLQDGSMIFIAMVLKKYNAMAVNIEGTDLEVYERYMLYKPLNTVKFVEYKKHLNLKIGELVILANDIFTRAESQHVAKIQEIHDDKVIVSKYARAYFNLESKYLVTVPEAYNFQAFYSDKPTLRRPYKEEKDFIDSVIIYHHNNEIEYAELSLCD